MGGGARGGGGRGGSPSAAAAAWATKARSSSSMGTGPAPLGWDSTEKVKEVYAPCNGHRKVFYWQTVCCHTSFPCAELFPFTLCLCQERQWVN
jgi:hypothetical protein